MSKSLKFIDLFAGLGGFHLALSSLGHSCVFASEKDGDLATLYQKNFNMKADGDIRYSWSAIPNHDVLCAGFPCQPFSKAGWQKGLSCPESGDMFGFVTRVIDVHEPQYLILENVPNLMRHDGGTTWSTMRDRLEKRGYQIDCRILSPAMFGVPQKRDRAIIVGAKKNSGGLSHYDWPDTSHKAEELSINSILDQSPNDATSLPAAFLRYLDVWQEFLDIIPATSPLPSFPIWAMEFGATYPFEDIAPAKRSVRSLSRFKGQFGLPLSHKSAKEQFQLLPPYARHDVEKFPNWKIKFIRDNRAFYEEHRDQLSEWLPKLHDFAPSFQKFEWNWKDGNRSIWDKIIQFRASGIRVKRPTVAPSLVALTTSQVPVIPWERRYMTMRECARLQSMNALRFLPASKTKAHQALGNAVNVEVISRVARNLLSDEKNTKAEVTILKPREVYPVANEKRSERQIAV